MSGKGGGKTVNTYQNTSPWDGQQGYLSDLFGRAQYQATAPSSPYTQQAVDARAAEGRNPNSITNQGKEQLSSTIQGDYLGANPYLDATVNRALGQTRSAVNAGFQGDNNGSSAHQEWLSNKLADTAFPYYMNNYESERGRQLNASLAAPQMGEASVGQLEKAGALANNSAWDPLARYQALIGGNYGGNTAGTQPYAGQNGMANMAGLGLLAYGAFK